MIDRSTEIIRQLNRVANDRNLPSNTRNQIREAIRHINELHAGVERIRELYFKLRDSRREQSNQAGENTANDAGTE